MFSERLSNLLELIGAKNSEIAQLIGFDRTNISRIKSGKRTITPQSSTCDKIIYGIYIFEDNKNDLTGLCSIINADPASSANDIMKALKIWLFEGDIHETVSKASKKSINKKALISKSLHHFGERLNSSMALAELSNIRLSHIIHADASLISRYRTGVRTPVSNPELATGISTVIYDRIIKNNKEAELAALIGISQEELEQDIFTAWLYNDETPNDDNSFIAEDLLDVIDSFTLKNTDYLVSEPDNNIMNIDEHQSVYYGISGIRDASLRLLKTAVDNEAKELFLYSDENMDWMTEDKAFYTTWAILMLQCVQKGIHINIIHNIDRSFSEMSDAIKSWLPLYMSGMITSYYCRKQNNVRFSHSIFLIPEMACISAFHVAGSSSNGIYYYHTDKRNVNIFRNEFNALLKSCSPLMHPIPAKAFPKVSDIIIIQNILSISTMPEELARSFNDSSFYKDYLIYRDAFEKQLRNHTIYECIPLVPLNLLSDDSVAIDYSSKTFYYTKQQYIMHIQNIINLTQEYENYRFYPIPEQVFPNTAILISENIVKIDPALNPELSFTFSHPALCNAFRDYALRLIDNCKIDKHSLQNNLKNMYNI
ncbi:MAG: hypothetical protein K6A23_04335 [Butyrivibrio sp.]|nr:hypothetical protein [Butyrivibrio sp.]